MDKRFTPIEKFINSLEEATLGMKNEPDNYVRNASLEIIELAKVFLSYEKLVIRGAFNDGEQNVWDRHRNENDFGYENGEDYFNKKFKK